MFHSPSRISIFCSTNSKLFIGISYFAATLLSNQSIADEEAEHQFFPSALHLEGVGNIYAAGIRSEYVGEEDVTVTAGVALGDMKAGALNITDIELSFLDGVVSSTSAIITKATLDTQYIRGVKGIKENNETAFEQSLTGIAQSIRYQEATSEDTSWYLNASLSQVTVEGYATDSGDDISMHLVKPFLVYFINPSFFLHI